MAMVSLLGVSLSTIISCLILLLVGLIVLSLLMVRLTTANKVPEIRRFESEKTYKDPSKNNATYFFPFMEEEGSVDLSLVVPAYNEQERIPIMLDEALNYLKSKKNSNPSFTYEVIVVDDGSKDKTTEVGLQYVNKYGISNIRVLTLAKNRGKGGAVRLGVLSSRGRKILMVDADGATKFSDLSRLDDKLNEIVKTKGVKSAIVVGSRSHLQDEAVAHRSLFRNFLMYGFHFLVWFLCVKGVEDTQCGFKLFTRPAAFLTFTALHVERWAFDVELLYIAQQLGISIAEVAVNWTEIDGSKMVPFWSWLQMGKDLMLIRLRYVLNAWVVDPVKLKTQ